MSFILLFIRFIIFKIFYTFYTFRTNRQRKKFSTTQITSQVFICFVVLISSNRILWKKITVFDNLLQPYTHVHAHMLESLLTNHSSFIDFLCIVIYRWIKLQIVILLCKLLKFENNFVKVFDHISTTNSF